MGIKQHLTSYVARHTYVSTLKEKSVAIAPIGKGLGHAEIGITKAYLKSFSNEAVDATDDVF